MFNTSKQTLQQTTDNIKKKIIQRSKMKWKEYSAEWVDKQFLL